MLIKLIKPYISSIFIQGGAMIIMMMVNLLVARNWGVQGSSVLSQVKVINDFGSTLFIMGYSQALAYYLGKNAKYLPFLMNGILIHSLLSLIFSTILALFLWNIHVDLLIVNDFFLYIIMGLSVGFLVATGLLRGVSIAVTSKIASSIISTIYSYVLFLILIIIIFLNLDNEITFIIYSNVIAALVSALLAAIIILRYYSKTKFSIETKKIRYSDLTKFGLTNLLIALLSTIIPFYTLYWLSRNGQKHLIGEFSVVIFFIAVITTPINIISPYWYSRWAAFDKKKLQKEFRDWFKILIIYSTLLSFIFLFLAKELIYFTFGQEFINAENASKLTGMLAFVYVVSRLLSAREMSQNNMTTLGISSTFRLITILLILLVKQGDPGLEYAAIAWILGEFIFILAIPLTNRIMKK